MILTIFSKDMAVNKRETSRRHCISTTAIEEKKFISFTLQRQKQPLVKRSHGKFSLDFQECLLSKCCMCTQENQRKDLLLVFPEYCKRGLLQFLLT